MHLGREHVEFLAAVFADWLQANPARLPMEFPESQGVGGVSLAEERQRMRGVLPRSALGHQ